MRLLAEIASKEKAFAIVLCSRMNSLRGVKPESGRELEATEGDMGLGDAL